MKFSRYVKDKINYTLGFIVYCMIIIAYTGAMQIDKDVSIVIITIFFNIFVFLPVIYNNSCNKEN